MEQQDQPVASDAPPSNKMRWIAVAATAIALLGISIPFVWQPDVDATPASTAATVTPAASHETAATQTARRAWPMRSRPTGISS